MIWNNSTMHIVVTGGTGFIGCKVVADFLSSGEQVTVLTRSIRATTTPSLNYISWDTLSTQQSLLETADAVVHLSGNSIAKPWTRNNKIKMRTSRVSTIEQLM